VMTVVDRSDQEKRRGGRRARWDRSPLTRGWFVAGSSRVCRQSGSSSRAIRPEASAILKVRSRTLAQ
jgi:hypothetical protein